MYHPGLRLAFVSPLKHNQGMIKLLDNKWLTIEEATNVIGCTPSYVRYLLREQKLAGKKISERAWLVDMKSAHKYGAKPQATGRPKKNIPKK